MESMRKGIAVFSATCLALANVSSQTFVVDEANGPGAHFVSIAGAIASVPDGAVLLVRPGIYTGFTISGKGLSVLGEAGVGVTGPVFVDSTSPSQSVVVRGLTMNSFSLCLQEPTKVGLTNCNGPVLLEEVATPAGLFGSCIGVPLRVQSSSQVIVRNCLLAGRTQVHGSEVVFDGGDLFGWVGNNPSNPDSSGLLLDNSAVQIVGSAVRGGNGNASFTVGSPGIEMNNSDLRLLPGASVEGGTGVPGTPSPTIVATGANQLRIDPSVPLTGPGPQTQGVQGQVVWMPAVHATGGTAGGSLDASVTTRIGDLVILVVGLRGAPTSIPGLVDDFWLAPGTYSFLAVAVQTSTLNPVAGSISVPAAPSFAGLQLAWHAVSSGPVTGFQNSNPGISLIH